MADDLFEHPRLVALYDLLDPDRSDLEVYAAVADELDAVDVLDIGCGTGTFALLLAGRGRRVVGLDPASASLAVSRGKPGAERVAWVHGDATNLPPLSMDLATMTGNVAQAVLDPVNWHRTLTAVRDALRPGGHLVLETRDPAARAWQEWSRGASYRVTQTGVGAVSTWVELTDVSWPLVSFRWTYRFQQDGAVLTSDSTLRFRTREEVAGSLAGAGFELVELRGAPDRPGRELVFVARRP